MVRKQSNKSFRYVRQLPGKQIGKVTDHLSAQFTVVWQGDLSFEFLLYKDEGVTWERGEVRDESDNS